MRELTKLANFIKQRNTLEREITQLIDRPANVGHIGEFVASQIFGLTLLESASNKGFDGFFTELPLKNRTVNIKWTAKNDGLLNINPNALPDFFLVLTGPKSPPVSSRGQFHPWVIKYVYLFESHHLIHDLDNYEVKIGIATSVRKHLWEKSEIYPAHNSLLEISQEQREALQLFSEP
jgi:hypothetical protein